MQRAILGCVYTSMALAVFSVITSLLLTLKNYKRDMLLIYRGRQVEIPEADNYLPKALLLSGARYVGYQTAYASWGMI